MNHKILEQMVRNHRKNAEHTQQLWHSLQTNGNDVLHLMLAHKAAQMAKLQQLHQYSLIINL